MLRAVYGIRQMSPASASVRIIWYTVGGVTPKCRWKSASAVARASGGAGWPPAPGEGLSAAAVPRSRDTSDIEPVEGVRRACYDRTGSGRGAAR